MNSVYTVLWWKIIDSSKTNIQLKYTSGTEGSLLISVCLCNIPGGNICCNAANCPSPEADISAAPPPVAGCRTMATSADPISFSADKKYIPYWDGSIDLILNVTDVSSGLTTWSHEQLKILAAGSMREGGVSLVYYILCYKLSNCSDIILFKIIRLKKCGGAPTHVSSPLAY